MHLRICSHTHTTICSLILGSAFYRTRFLGLQDDCVTVAAPRSPPVWILVFGVAACHESSVHSMQSQARAAPVLFQMHSADAISVAAQVHVSRCLYSRRLFSFLFLLPCFFQAFPALLSALTVAAVTMPLPGL